MKIRKLNYGLLIVFLAIVWVNSASSNKENNPILKDRTSPIDFASIQEGDFPEAATVIFNEAETVLQTIYVVEPNSRTFENTLLALDDLKNIIENLWSPSDLIGNVHPDSQIRKEGLEVSQQAEQFLNSLDSNEELYQAITSYAKTDEAKSLKGVKKKLLDDSLLKFRRGGFGLNKKTREEVADIRNRLVEIGTEFDRNKNQALDTLFLNESELAGLPESYIASHKMEDGRYAIDLSYPSYKPFMKYADSGSARKDLRFLYMNRASDVNISVLDSLIYYRNLLAETLGYSSYAAYRTEDRMVKIPETVWAFENNLKEDLKEKAFKDYSELLEMKSAQTGKSETVIETWESWYYETKLLKEKYQLDPEEVRQYFEISTVIDGMFMISQQLFDVVFKKVENPSVWHEDVLMYEVFEGKTNKLIGRFYLDVFPRPNKYSHAAAFSVVMGKQLKNGYQKPTTALVCNFPPPTENHPSLLPYDDVETFFHEFGHLLHGVLTKSPYMTYAGTSVAHDFVETPSQIFENWIWEKESLSLFAKHYQTGEMLPDALFDKMIATKNVNSGNNYLQQVYYGILDFTLHDGFDINGEETTTDVVARLQNEITLYPYLEGTQMQASFGHLNGYGASYYGYLWALVYAQDMFSVFSENGIMNPEIGIQFRKVILEKGGTADPFGLVVKFLGREPNNQAFLKSLGL